MSGIWKRPRFKNGRDTNTRFRLLLVFCTPEPRYAGHYNQTEPTYLPYEPDQQLLLPSALQEWLPDDHLAYFISDVVDQLDISEVTARYERERRGGPPYHPRMMVKVLLYGYCVGVASSRRIAQRLHEDIAFRVLAANNTPDGYVWL